VQKGMKHVLKPILQNATVSAVLRTLATPVVRLCDAVSREARRTIAINGVSVMVDDLRLNFPKDVGVLHSSPLYWQGSAALRSDIWWVLRPLVQTSCRFADVGSYIGFLAVLAKKANSACDVWAFEPVPSIAEQNRRFQAANHVSLTFYEAALSDRNGVATLFLPRASGVDEESTGTIRPDSWQASRAASGQAKPIEVETKRLDDLCEEADWWPDLVKIDAEDHEARVLRGMRKIMQRDQRPYIICEVLPRDHGNLETLAWVKENDYALYAITPSGLFRVTEFPRARTFTDYLLAPLRDGPEYLSPLELDTWIASARGREGPRLASGHA